MADNEKRNVRQDAVQLAIVVDAIDDVCCEAESGDARANQIQILVSTVKHIVRIHMPKGQP
jgi:hypothetical protein